MINYLITIILTSIKTSILLNNYYFIGEHVAIKAIQKTQVQDY